MAVRVRCSLRNGHFRSRHFSKADTTRDHRVFIQDVALKVRLASGARQAALSEMEELLEAVCAQEVNARKLARVLRGLDILKANGALHPHARTDPKEPRHVANRATLLAAVWNSEAAGGTVEYKPWDAGGRRQVIVLSIRKFAVAEEEGLVAPSALNVIETALQLVHNHRPNALMVEIRDVDGRVLCKRRPVD